MTIETWKQEFYPTSADTVTQDDAIQHSLTKWKGLRNENLERHGLTRSGCHITDSDLLFRIDASTCSLCTHYYKDMCEGCPIVAEQEETCDHDGDYGGTGQYRTGQYQSFTMDGNPEPMIDLLERCLQTQKETHGT